MNSSDTAGTVDEDMVVVDVSVPHPLETGMSFDVVILNMAGICMPTVIVPGVVVEAIPIRLILGIEEGTVFASFAREGLANDGDLARDAWRC